MKDFEQSHLYALIAGFLLAAVLGLFLSRGVSNKYEEQLRAQLAVSDSANATMVRAYVRQIDSLRLVSAAKDTISERLRGAVRDQRAKLAALTNALPSVTPAECAPYLTALTNCELLVIRLDSVTAADSSQIATLKQADSLSILTIAGKDEQLSLREQSIRSLERQLAEAGCHINLGIFQVGCPSPLVTLALGVGVGLWLNR